MMVQALELEAQSSVQSEMIPGLPIGGPKAQCKAGPGHQNTPTINIIDTSQKQEHKLKPTFTEGRHHLTESVKRQVREAV